MEVRGQIPEVGSLLPPCGSQGLESGLQATGPKEVEERDRAGQKDECL